MSRPFITVISPVYRAEQIVPLLVTQLKNELTTITENYEIVLVEDDGPDKSWCAIEKEAQLDCRVKGIKLSRNFGQHYAITAGIDHAKGEWVVVMDCDLQDKPSEIKKLYNKALEGYDLVLARRAVRNDIYHKKLFSKLFYSTLGYLTGTLQDPAIANFGIYNYKVIDAIRCMREPIRYFPTMVRWVGFKRITLDVSHGAREIGETSYNFEKLMRLGLDIILANSDKPIRLTIKFGFLVALFSFAFGVYTIFQYFTGNIVVLGYTSLLISIWFLSGLILMVLGVLGLYLGKTFEGVKNRPIYIINKQLNVES
jgi:polyisoprenyl-phosphate glycosyltransferase